LRDGKGQKPGVKICDQTVVFSVQLDVIANGQGVLTAEYPTNQPADHHITVRDDWSGAVVECFATDDGVLVDSESKMLCHCHLSDAC